MSQPGTRSDEIRRWDRDAERAVCDRLVVEEPMEIRVDGRSLAVLMRTPGQDEELAAGFLLTEGFIESLTDLAGIRPCENGENILRVAMVPGAGAEIRRRLDGERRHVVAGSSCGVCGKASIEDLRRFAEPFPKAVEPSPETLKRLPSAMRSLQPAFDSTGGLHAAALFSSDGRCLVLREDIGRHNAADKVVGACLMQDRAIPHAAVLLVSGRVSFEIVQKAWMAGIPAVAALGAASSLAVDLAREARMALVWFLKEARWNRL
jgi:FdhD protein